LYDAITHAFLLVGSITGLFALAVFWALVIYFGIDEIIGWFVDAPDNLEGNEDELG
jgi:hypothetical protein